MQSHSSAGTLPLTSTDLSIYEKTEFYQLQKMADTLLSQIVPGRPQKPQMLDWKIESLKKIAEYYAKCEAYFNQLNKALPTELQTNYLSVLNSLAVLCRDEIAWQYQSKSISLQKYIGERSPNRKRSANAISSRGKVNTILKTYTSKKSRLEVNIPQILPNTTYDSGNMTHEKADVERTTQIVGKDNVKALLAEFRKTLDLCEASLERIKDCQKMVSDDLDFCLDTYHHRANIGITYTLEGELNVTLLFKPVITVKAAKQLDTEEKKEMQNNSNMLQPHIINRIIYLREKLSSLKASQLELEKQKVELNGKILYLDEVLRASRYYTSAFVTFPPISAQMDSNSTNEPKLDPSIRKSGI